MAHRLHDFQNDGLFGQQSQSPVGESFRRQPQPQGNDLGFLISVEDLSTNSTLRFAVERDLKPFGHETLPNVFYGLRATIECVSDLRIRPVGPIRICLEQNSGAKDLLSRNPSLLDQTTQYLPLGIRQPNNILLLHGPTLLGWAYIDQKCQRTLP
jgi:hypothetical protein